MIGFGNYSQSRHFSNGKPFANVDKAKSLTMDVEKFFEKINDDAGSELWNVKRILTPEKLDEVLNGFLNHRLKYVS